MKLLALDAGLGPFSAALWLDGITTAERSDHNDALEAGLGRIAGLLERAGVGLRELDCIAVGAGPGSFTGIRIAISFAKALAFGARLPLVGVSSYDALTPRDAPLPCLTLVAGRSGVVCARLQSASGSSIACGPTSDVFTRLTAGLGHATLTLVAATEDVFPVTGEGPFTVHRFISPAARNPAVAIAALAAQRTGDSAHTLIPDYGEIPAVTVPRATTFSVRASKEAQR